MSGSSGVGRVARAAGDGYTLGIGTFAQYVNNGAIYSLPAGRRTRKHLEGTASFRAEAGHGHRRGLW